LSLVLLVTRRASSSFGVFERERELLLDELELLRRVSLVFFDLSFPLDFFAECAELPLELLLDDESDELERARF